MKKFKSVITMCVLMLTVAVSTKAQTTFSDLRQMSSEQKAQLITDSLTTTLNLSSDQSQHVYTLALDGATKTKGIVSADGDRMSKGKQLRSLMRDEETKLKSLLTANQVNIYEKKKRDLVNYYRSNLRNQPIIFNVPAS